MIESRDRSIKTLNSKIESLEGKVTAVGKERDECKTEKEGAVKEVSKLKLDLATAVGRLDPVVEKGKKLEVRVTQLKEELTMKGELLAEIQTSMTETIAKSGEEGYEIKVLKEEREAQKAAIEGLEGRLKGAIEEKLKAESEVTSVRSDFDRLRLEVKGKDEEIKRIRIDLNNAKRDKSTTKGEAEGVREGMNKLTRELKEARERCRVLERDFKVSGDCV